MAKRELQDPQSATLLRVLLAFAKPAREIAEIVGCSNGYLSSLADGHVKDPDPAYVQGLAEYFSGFCDVEVLPSALLRRVSVKNLVIAQGGARPLNAGR